jgi:hypothetical protein
MEEVLNKIKDTNCSVTFKILRQFRPVKLLDSDCMYCVKELFRSRSEKIYNVHKQINGRKADYESVNPAKILKLKQNLFFDCKTFRFILEYTDQLNDENFIANNWRRLFPGLDYDLNIFSNINRIYYLVKNSEDENIDDWRLLILDLTYKRLYFIDPKYPNNLELIENEAERGPLEEVMSGYKSALNNMWRAIFPNYDYENNLGGFICTIFPYQYQEVLLNNFDSGVYVATILYFLVTDTPIYFRMEDCPHLRNFFAYWLNTGELCPY